MPNVRHLTKTRTEPLITAVLLNYGDKYPRLEPQKACNIVNGSMRHAGIYSVA